MKAFLIFAGICLGSMLLINAKLDHSGTTGGSSSGLGFLVLLVGAILLYFVPAIISGARRCEAHNGILVVNLFLGWTFIGWVVALAWAASGKQRITARQLTEEEKRLGVILLSGAEVTDNRA